MAWMDHMFIHRPWVDTWVTSALAVVTHAAVNISVRESACVAFHFFGGHSQERNCWVPWEFSFHFSRSCSCPFVKRHVFRPSLCRA